MSNHTPGPWFVNDDCIEAGGPEGPRDVTVAVVTGFTNPREANAHLVAAAPELYEALSNLAHTIQAMSAYIPAQNALIREEYHARTQAAFRVMRKAEGKGE